jgi:hypothetical protein
MGDMTENDLEVVKQAEITWRKQFASNWAEFVLSSVPYKYPALLGGKMVVKL